MPKSPVIRLQYHQQAHSASLSPAHSAHAGMSGDEQDRGIRGKWSPIREGLSLGDIGI
jgi:hypothetical protein